MTTGENCPRCGHELELLDTTAIRDRYCPECDERRIAPSARSPYNKGFDAAEFCDPRGRRANEYKPQSKEWWEFENGFSSYESARSEMQEDEGYDERADEED